MDNLTHSLIGVTFARVLPKRLQRPEIYWASVLGNNFPDADFLIRTIPGTDALDYLVHHRGYTHTFFLAPLVALGAAFVARKISRRKEWDLSVLIVAFVGCLMHIGADFMNSYGVHPFTPFSDHWYYGDSVYIVEPLIWFTLIPFIAVEASRRWARLTWWILAVPLVILVWIFPGFKPVHSGLLTGFFAASTLLVFSTEPFARRFAVTALLGAVIGGFFYAGTTARNLARGYWQGATEGMETWIDTVSSPEPGNLFCWNIWLASKSSTNFHMRSAVVSIWPSKVSVESCEPRTAKVRTAVTKPSSFQSTASIRWDDEATIRVDDWRELENQSATFRRFLSFSRLPFIRKNSNGETIVGDLRYDRESGLGFSEFEIPKNEKASTTFGPWRPPFRGRD